jgi:hypothetical protein
VSREVGVEAHRLQAWRDDFLVPRGELGWSFDARSW